jgi:hypothetical protein
MASPPKREYRDFPPRLQLLAVKLRESGMSYADVAKRLKRKEAFIKKVLGVLRGPAHDSIYVDETRHGDDEHVRCPKCMAKLLVSPCRACRLKEYVERGYLNE